MIIVRIILLLWVAACSAFALSEQRADEQFDVTASAKLIVDVDFATVDVSRGADSKIAVNVHRKIDINSTTSLMNFAHRITNLPPHSC